MQRSVEIDSDLVETVIGGDWAFTRDIYEARYQPAGGGDPIIERGRSLAIWQRQPDGTWLISRYLFNRPTAGPG